MGNRLQRQDSASGATNYTYNAANEMLTNVGGNGNYSASYDADGNSQGDGGANSYYWDGQNRLVQNINGDSIHITSYTYGADGLRRSQTVKNSGGGLISDTDYVYDGQSLVREMQKNAQGVLVPSATYLNGPRGPEYRRDDSAVGTPVRWYVYDGLGSVVGEVDPSGNLTASAKYDVYGAKRSGGTGTATSRQGFVGSLGHVTDDETGLVYMRARYYDPAVGRFISEDPSKNGKNWFAYCSNSPTVYYDPSGKDGELVGELGAISLGSSLNATDAMSAVAAAEFDGMSLSGEATFMSASGMGTPVDTILETYGQGADEIAKTSWEYYKSNVSEMPGIVMKAWLRLNGEEFDAYLKCAQDIDGDTGFATHDMPYVGTDSDPDW